MEIHDKMPLEALPGHILIEVNHRLVRPLHEIYLDSLYAPITVRVKDFFHVFHHRGPQGPEDNPNALLITVPDKLMKVKTRLRVHDVHRTGGPSFIHEYILQAGPGREIDIVFVSLRIDPGLEVHAIDIEHAPPLPGNLARPYPGSVIGIFRGGELPRKGVLQERLVIPQCEYPPGKRTGCPGLCDIIRFPEHIHIPVCTHFRLQNYMRQFRLKRSPPAPEKEQVRIVQQIRFGNHHPCSSGSEHTYRKI